MPEGMTEILKVAGSSGLVFIVFYIYHKSSTEQLNAVIDKTFKLLSTMIEQNALQLSYLQKIDTKVSNNIWCPFVRKNAHSDKEAVIND